jgi:hypothetical protein
LGQSRAPEVHEQEAEEEVNPITFVVKEVTSKEKAGGIRFGRIALESANAKGTSKVTIVTDEETTDEFQLGEFYELNLKQVKAPE